MAEAKAEKSKPKGKGKGKGKAEKTLEGLQPEKERRLHADGYDWVYGVDEAGRGPLAGPVVTACCYVPPELDIPGIMVRGQGGGTEHRGVDCVCRDLCRWPVCGCSGVIWFSCVGVGGSRTASRWTRRHARRPSPC